MEIEYFTCLARGLYSPYFFASTGNSFVNGSTAISVYLNEYLLVISLGCWLELTLHIRSEDSTYISCKGLPTYFVLNFYCMMIHHNLEQKRTAKCCKIFKTNDGFKLFQINFNFLLAEKFNKIDVANVLNYTCKDYQNNAHNSCTDDH
ncbi:hypothetical protein T12_4387 [Trichinella patagoniensis]|uniref:Uncharacterized protein n=1 Tax=Trichinella patagoniensis TaxID=990121 RepID=A0A0V0ZSP8_9BILA|nr:hypothetical protein T12_4387 [Trichinella patagoniensis]